MLSVKSRYSLLHLISTTFENRMSSLEMRHCSDIDVEERDIRGPCLIWLANQKKILENKRIKRMDFGTDCPLKAGLCVLVDLRNTLCKIQPQTYFTRQFEWMQSIVGGWVCVCVCKST